MEITKTKSNQYVFRLFGFNLFVLFIRNGIGYFRIFGKGLLWKNKKIHRLYFSERNGYSKALNIGNWRISYLP